MKIQNASLNPKVDTYLIDGCGRCEYYKTPKCNVSTWREALKQLRFILLDCGLKEEYKWSQPCYTFQGKNVAIISAMKDNAVLSFFKGSLLKDQNNLLEAPGPNSQAARYMKFTEIKNVLESEPSIRAFITEAIDLEKQGKKVEFKKNPEPMPQELIEKFNSDAAFKVAFESLTLGRQRGYILTFSQPKQSKTRISRIEKHYANIMMGKGIHDDYKSKQK